MSFDPSATQPGKFTVLAVCTGNICRSPAVERLLVAGLDPESDVAVRSAGVGAVVGAPIAAPMAALLREAGAPTDSFVARQLTERMLHGADLVLALTKAHRSKVVSLHPSVVRRTFTLREFARLADGVDPADLPVGSDAIRLSALIPLASAQRGHRAASAGEDDVVDPYGGDHAKYERSFGELLPAVNDILRVLRG